VRTHDLQVRGEADGEGSGSVGSFTLRRSRAAGPSVVGLSVIAADARDMPHQPPIRIKARDVESGVPAPGAGRRPRKSSGSTDRVHKEETRAAGYPDGCHHRMARGRRAA